MSVLSKYEAVIRQGYEDEIRLLRRQRWCGRADSAKHEWQYWWHRERTEGDAAGVYYRVNHRSSSRDGATLRTLREWRLIWQAVERKCRRKADEYQIIDKK